VFEKKPGNEKMTDEGCGKNPPRKIEGGWN
jgi:hypothetical protein